MSIRRLMTAVVAAAVAAVPLIASAACGGGSDTAASPLEIDQKGLRFQPSMLTVKAGATITFRNSDSALHTVRISNGVKSGDMHSGDTYTWTTGATGSFKVMCDYHPQMKATITVE